MKLGICTLVPYDNYGGILQGLALQTILERLGHKVYIIRTKRYDYVPKSIVIKNSIKWFFKRFFLYYKDTPCIDIYCYRNYRVQNIVPFINKWIHFTRSFKSTKDLYKFEEKEHFDGFIMGSDQIWRPELSPNLYHMFCDFLPKSSEKKRIAYAASFGVDHNVFSKKQLEVCCELIRRFDAVAVREKTGVNLCKSLFNINAVQVLDPTMLLDKEDYLSLIEKYNPINKNIDLMQYVFSFQHEEQLIINKVSEILNFKSINLMTKRFLHQVYKKNQLDDAVFYPVEEWIYAYSHSKFVITDSFHGTVFCIIFNVPFLVVSPEAPTRLQSLLETYGLEDRLIMTKEEITKELILSKIDWSAVNRKRAELKKQSMLYLTENLKGS